ncbi:class I SAM-dependent methyltransferase, partial [Candidatus Dependentiae bacterium]
IIGRAIPRYESGYAIMDPKNFYEKIGVEGLSSMSSEEKTAAQIKFLQKFISQKHRILDVGCGYGRITIPLAKMGYQVEGIDLSPNLLEEAKKQAKKENLKLTFKVGDMRSLPYKDERFDIIVCMWSTFSYMLTEHDQIQAINEMCRALAKNGTLIIDLPAATENKIRNGVFIEPNVLKKEIMGIEHTVYLHTKETLSNLLKSLKNIKSYEVKYKNVNGTRRLFAFIKK